MDNAALQSELVRLRRQIHRHPELGNEEFRTAELIERQLKSLHIPSKRYPPTGVVGWIASRGLRGNGPCVALRADMDALPLAEKTGKPYASKTPGVMHACGHDGHVSMLLGAARLLAAKKGLTGCVKLFFQPNEEGAGGARSLIERGAMENPKVQTTFGLHVNPRFPTGTIAIKPGPLMAAVDKFTLEILGRGGHAAYPHEGRDALLIAAEVVQALQSIVSRRLNPLDPAVLTVGTFQAGTRFNILPGRALLTGTVRTLSEAAHRQVPVWMRRIASGVCRAHGADFRLRYERIGSVLSNHPGASDFARAVAERIFGRGRLLRPEAASMGGEDFSEYLKRAPGCFIYIGTGNPALRSRIPWHHPQFEIDERALSVGARLLAGLAEDFLRQGGAFQRRVPVEKGSEAR